MIFAGLSSVILITVRYFMNNTKKKNEVLLVHRVAQDVLASPSF